MIGWFFYLILILVLLIAILCLFWNGKTRLRRAFKRQNKDQVFKFPIIKEEHLSAKELASTSNITTPISFLKDDEPYFHEFREIRQNDLNQYRTKVHTRDHTHEERATHSLTEGESYGDQHKIAPHKLLSTLQLYDGVPDLDPRSAQEFERDFENRLRDEAMEKQLRLGNVLQPGTAPTPRPR